LIYFCVRHPWHGFTFVLFPTFASNKRKLLAFTAGGIAANFALASISLLAAISLPGRLFWGMVALINAYFALVNALPLKHVSPRVRIGNDGDQLLRIWRGRGAVSSIPTIQTIHDLRELWQAIGDRRAESAFLTTAAAIWDGLGHQEHAQALLADARLVLPELPAKAQVLAELLDAAEHERVGRFDAAALVYEKLHREFAKAADADGMFTVQCQQAVLAACRGDTETAERLLPGLENDPLLVEQPALAIVVLTALLKLPSHSTTSGRIARLRNIIETGQRPIELDWNYYRLLTAHHIACQAWSAAEETALAAWKTTLVIHDMLPAEDRARFERCLGPFREMTRSLLQRIGKVADGEQMGDYFVAAAANWRRHLAEEQASKVRRRDDRFRIAGSLLTMVNALVLAVSAAALLLSPTMDGPNATMILSVVVFLQVPCVAASLIYLKPGLLTRFAGPTHQECAGTMALMLAVLPWAAAIVLALIVGPLLLGPE
jgi:hypothetical protein